jgi:ATP-dependent DNA helicase PIF1
MKRKREECNAGEILSQSQKDAMELALSGSNLFITGAAGNGKSYLIKRIVERLRENGKKVLVTASTGVAAFNTGGTTLHNFAGVGLGTGELRNLVSSVKRDPIKALRWRDTDVLVVDEISMIAPDYLAKLNELAKKVRASTRAFGGIQLIMVGDYLQLLPVPNKKDDASVLLFNTSLWIELRVRNVVLKENFRQRDDAGFGALLKRVRLAKTTLEDEETLRARLSTKHLDVKENDLIRLCPQRREAEEINRREIGRLQGKTHLFVGAVKHYNPDGKEKMPIKEYESETRYPVDMELPLKVGAHVLLCCNLDVRLGLFNGARGTVIDFRSADAGADQSTLFPWVQFECGEARLVVQHRWESKEGNRLVAVFTQLPLLLRYGVTIHKAQGLTLDGVLLTMKNLFADGQFYVALSRARKLEDVYLSDIDVKKPTASKEVISFYEKNGLL